MTIVIVQSTGLMRCRRLLAAETGKWIYMSISTAKRCDIVQRATAFAICRAEVFKADNDERARLAYTHRYTCVV